MLIIRVCMIVVCAVLIFAMSKWQAAEKKTAPSRAVLRVTKVINLLCAALITIAVVGQIVDLAQK